MAKKVYELLLIVIISENSFSLMFIITAENNSRRKRQTITIVSFVLKAEQKYFISKTVLLQVCLSTYDLLVDTRH